MSVNFYGDKNAAASLAGISASLISDDQLKVINDWIIANIKNSGFEESALVTEYYDIKRTGQKELILKNFPISEVYEIIDNSQNNTLVLESSSYVVDSESGIIQLLECGKLKEFTCGFNSVKVTYKYGFISVPEIIKSIANLMLAKWCKIKESQSDADGLKSIKIGDYSESFDIEFLNIESEFDNILNPMIKSAKNIFNDGV